MILILLCQIILGLSEDQNEFVDRPDEKGNNNSTFMERIISFYSFFSVPLLLTVPPEPPSILVQQNVKSFWRGGGSGGAEDDNKRKKDFVNEKDLQMQFDDHQQNQHKSTGETQSHYNTKYFLGAGKHRALIVGYFHLFYHIGL